MKHGRDLQSYLKLGDRKQDFFREEFLFESCQGFEKKIICKIILQYGFYILPCYAFRNVLEKKKSTYARSQFRLLLLNCLNSTQREMRQVNQKVKVASRKNVVQQ